MAILSAGYMLSIGFRPLNTPADAKGSQLTVADIGQDVPSFGSGPLNRIVQLTRVNGPVEAIPSPVSVSPR